MIGTEIRSDGVAVLTIDTPGTQNALDHAFNTAFEKEVAGLLANQAVKGIVIASGKDSFAAGGDLQQLLSVKSPADARAIVEPFLAALRKLETGGKPVVAALNGTALGGGYELALAAHRRIAADRPDVQFGLPEATLGLMPGGGGTQRLPRMIGIEKAADLILSGKTMSPKEALAAGLVDEVVSAGELVEAAARWILANPKAQQPWDAKGFSAPGFEPNDVLGRRFFASRWAKLRAKAGEHDDAASAVLYALHHGMERTLDAGIEIEKRQFGRLAASVYAKNKVRTLFYGPRAARPKPSSRAGEGIGKLGVVGGGTMGNGIAFTAARAGLAVTLIDVSDEKAAESLLRIGKIAEKLVSRGRLSESARDEIMGRIAAADDYGKLADADFVIEAVFERLDVKHDVYRKLETVLRPDVTIASNTSSIVIAKLAAGLSDPSRMIGMHFFAPVETMKLLEVIRAPETSDRAFDQAQHIAALMKKTQIVVKDGPGFYTSRLVSSLSSEAMTLLAEGVPPQIIDNAMTSAGFAIGPVTLAELTKLPLLKDIMISMSETPPQSMKGSLAVVALEKLVDAGRGGRDAGKGIYDYGEDGPRLWDGLSGLFPAAQETLPYEDVRRRLINTQSLEAARAIEDGTIDEPLAADIAAVLGWSYPPHLGGPLGYIDTVGVSEFVAQSEALAQKFGERFMPPALLKRMADRGETFHAA
jgi:3-hydroxyacyl-CoA dehydrogenase/enoyl-CoA hydratase/3-hydroxybutyryl-CoA epimerase